MAQPASKLLFVVGAGGPPFEYALPRLARQADLYALVATEVSKAQRDLLSQWCAGVAQPDLAGRPESIVDEIVAAARRFGAGGIITFSEFAVIAVAQACARLGLPGPGPNARLARDKWLMRQRWSEAGLPEPRFAKVGSLADLEAATRTLAMPFLLKSAGRGGGIGQQVIDATTVLPEVLKTIGAVLDQAAEHGIVEYSEGLDVGHWVAEEIIDSTTDSWYDDSRYGDFLSVEGIVAGGEYHPVCITGRLPTLPPFAEIGAVSPCVLREDLQRKIEDLARASVNALGLETCGTHTEFKLMSDERLCLLETAARLGGSTAVALAEVVFGIDLIGLQASEALGQHPSYPERMLTSGTGAAASLYLFAASTAGQPWAAQTAFNWKQLDWTELVSGASRVEILPSQMIPDGTVITPYRPGSGALNYAGSVLLHSPDAETLLTDSYRLINNLEAALRTVEAAANGNEGR